MNILSLIPDSVVKMIFEEMIKFLAEQAEKHAGDQLASKIRAFSSQAEFYKSTQKAIQKGTQRFTQEYLPIDEDLALEIGKDKALWESPALRKALIELIRRPGSWQVESQDAILGHFDEILPQRINRQRVDKAVSHLLRCIVEELWALPGTKEIREVYALQFQRISAEAVHRQAELMRQQLEATTQLNSELRQAMLQLSGALEQKLLTAPNVAALPPRPRPYHNLPRPDYQRFVGREEELAWLRQRLSPQDRAWQIAITGIGGVGKSALALAIGYEYVQEYNELPEAERFEAIVWVSAKEWVLTIQGTEPSTLPENIFRSLEDAYKAIARTLEREDITRAEAKDQPALVERALKEQRTLLIMDNLESVQDERIRPFLRNLPAPTKAIITSREWLDVADVKELRGLSEADADSLILQESEARQVTLEAGQRQRIYELTSGLPLPIKLAVARLAAGASFEAVERWLGDAEGDLPEYCIQGQAEWVRKRHPAAWKLLLACTLFNRSTGASADALRFVADLSIKDTDKGLERLQRLFLINRSERGRFWVLPIVQRYVNTQMTTEETAGQLILRWLEWLMNFAQENGVDLDWKKEVPTELEREYPNLLSAIRWCYEQKNWQALMKLAEGTWGFAYRYAYFHEVAEILYLAEAAAQETGNEALQGKIALQRARVAVIRREVGEQTCQDLETAEQAARKFGAYRDLAEALATRNDLLRFHQQFEQVRSIGLELIELGEKHQDPYVQYMGALRLYRIERQLKNYPEGLAWLEKAETWARQFGAARLIANVQAQRGNILAEQGSLAEAEDLLLQGLNAHLELNDRRSEAYIRRNLANLYAQTGRYRLAEQYGREAKSLFERIGMAWYAEDLDKLLASVAGNEQAGGKT